jgi:hypothetical protein
MNLKNKPLLPVVAGCIALLGISWYFQVRAVGKASWLGYIYSQDDYVKPLVRMLAVGLAWPIPVKAYRAGSQVFDATTNTQYYLWSDGVAWTTVLSSAANAIRTCTTTCATNANDGTILCDATACRWRRKRVPKWGSCPKSVMGI